ncbi:hypothetical protein VHEMI10419 [[Torrubiella] hemipterigena]|uniref:Zn(2)-C6 fungal-type domain-containing protein n=1 Tax=[Torrubiella] hemipterigena TaxID=1531966 RepID=A0A0A1TS41_9HYPO|nr:hypothetical protein VHEMI10419 [[Torrubiella] hemipterigena]
MEKATATTTSQAWRKKPRKFAPKSRLGCKTCKIRRIKCDLARPCCQKCQSTGRVCDGYPEPAGNNTIQKQQPLLLQTECRNIARLKPLMLAPAASPVERATMDFFQHVSINTMNEYMPSELWHNTVMLLAQTVPAVRHATLALAVTHRNHLDRLQQVQRLPASPGPEQIAQFHYQKAIQLLLGSDTGGSSNNAVVTLLVCYLFVCFGSLSGQNNESLMHLQAGVKLSNDMMPSKQVGAISLSDNQSIISQVSRRLERLNMQTAMFVTDWVPTNIHKPGVFQATNGAFASLDEAIDGIQFLVSQTMRLHHNTTEVQLSSAVTPSDTHKLGLPSRDTLLTQSSMWLPLFDNMPPESKGGSNSAVVMLIRLHYAIVRILLSCQQPGRELMYDEYLSDFQKCTDMIDQITAIHSDQSSAFLDPIWTPEIGIIPVLYIIGAKCRDPTVRRQVLMLLRRRPMRESIWDNLTTAKGIERIMAIEEAALEELGTDCLPLCHRIESVSMSYSGIGQMGTKMTFSYTRCGQDTVHTEKLVV